MDLGGRDLYQEMSTDRIVIDYLKDLSLATDFYGALCNVDWYLKRPPLPEDELIMHKLKGERDEYWSCSWRTAGRFISEIRNRHYGFTENYMNFYCAGNEGQVTDLVRECFERMGWTPFTYY